jgi:hydrogenase expression/formation protein HypE
VKAACELLGLDPLSVANEGTFISVVPADDVEACLRALAAAGLTDARAVARVVADHPRVVRARTALGGERVLALPAGEQLPRIC